MYMYEMIKLWTYLIDNNYNVRWQYYKKHIGYENEYLYINQIIVYDENNERLWDAICQYGSFGYEQGLIEIYGVICNDVVGYLTADDIINNYIEVGGTDGKNNS